MKYKSLWIILGILSVTSMAMGPINLFTGIGDTGVFSTILWELRLPRTLAALIIGATLGLSGAVLQGFLRNPLADASLIGIGAGASFGAVTALCMGISAWASFVLPACAMGGGALSILILTFFMKGTYNSLRLILAGIALNSLFGALTALLLNLSADPYGIMQILFWLFGSYAQVSLPEILTALPFMITGMYALWRTRGLLDALSLGEDMAKSMGFSLKQGYILLILGTGLSLGIGVALCGIIGFIGLVVPHIVRHLYGSKPSNILIPSALGGAILSLASDITVRLIPCTMELKVGVITALIGAPFFIYILYTADHADL